MLTALATFLAALLLFGVQPLLGKWLLPRHGGAPAVWGMALVFFQLALLAGYALAHVLARHLSPRGAGLAHAVLLGVGALALAVEQSVWGSPLLIPPGAGSATSWPGWSVLSELAVAAGIPVVAVAASAPILLASRAAARPGTSPYGLVALGNAGSLAALLAYPFVVEPRWDLEVQARGWWAGLGLLALLAAAQSARLPAAPLARLAREPIARWRWARWALLAGAPVAYLSAMTGALTHELAPIPLLWVVPLAVYLLAWIVPFRPGAGSWPMVGIVVGFACVAPISANLLSEQGYAVPEWSRAWGGASPYVQRALTVGAAVGRAVATAPIGAALGTLSLFGAAIACHGELARDRPESGGATSFTLAIAVGGAVGGMAVAAIAPLVFDDVLELPIAFLACATAALVVRRDATWGNRWICGGIVAFAAIVLAAPPLRPRPDEVEIRRTFFGVLRIRHIAAGTELEAHQLNHGGVSHGLQFSAEPYRHKPTAYYHTDSGVGRAIEAHPRRMRSTPMRVGLIGLGAGTLAAYGRPGDVFRFYEIDPEVVVLARRYFTFLDESAAAIELATGDGRVVLEQELAAGRPGRFDVLVLDAFGGGAIPVHLLTHEAAVVYRAHLAPGGIVAVHVSSVHVDLVPVVHGMASAIGLRAITVFHPGDPPATYPSAWVVASADERWLRSGAFSGITRPAPAVSREWTDRASDLLGVLRW